MHAVLDSDFLDEAFAALANPTRRAILSRLAEGSASVSELAEPFDMSLPAISRHVKVLESAGLISQGRQAQYRPCTIEAGPLQDISDWAQQYRALWETSLDRMDDYLNQVQSEPKPKKSQRKAKK